MPTDGVSTAKGRATRDRIVGAAAEIMYRKGVAGTAMPALRADAGVSSSQIYHYFTDKDALTKAVLDRWAEEIVASQIAVLASVEDFAGLRRWRDHVVNGAAGGFGCPLGVLTTELAGEDWARRAGGDGFERWQHGIGDALDRLVECGVLGDDVEAASWSVTLLSAVQGGLLLSRVTGSTQALATALDTTLDALARAGEVDG
ncbi:TetR/AcrR family transcriptional regulator [Rhodococcoides fascians A25f]|uniref:TetR/AcrR family transcriptional regulator n=1 Tax=Rhodococcoides fascians TaxID=1828 RepID=UPI0005643F3C|nr:TetR/AcrR family transcriptional regulator [Rhodococcus fascians]QII04295.1 TetR/AcrR family transcriptional regulator [Rhodococcus fascians A25f]